MGRVTLWPEVIQQVLHEQAACFVYIQQKGRLESSRISFSVFFSVVTVLCHPFSSGCQVH